MLQHIAHGHRLPVHPSPLGEPIGDERFQRERAGPDQLHHNRRRGDRLGERREIVDGVVGGGGRVRRERQVTERLGPEEAVGGADFHGRRREDAGRDRVLDHAARVID